MKYFRFVLIPVLALHAATIPMDSTRGDELFQSQGCVQCHSLKGIGGRSAPDLGRMLDRAYSPSDLASTMWNHAPTMWGAIAARGIKVGDISQQDAADLFAAFYSARYFEMQGDAGHGKSFFQSRSCATCHGLTHSPNPAAKPVNEWTTLGAPVALVGAMWNHSPDMWEELALRKKPWPNMTPQDMTDLLVYLRNAVPGRAVNSIFRIPAGEEGERLFGEKGCTSCHDWQRPPKQNLTLTGVAAEMWNHAAFLHSKPPRIEPDEMREILSSWWAKQFFEDSGDASHGKRLFAAKHCIQCHSGAGPGPALPSGKGGWSGITMVSALWRHGPSMFAQMKEHSVTWLTFKAGEMSDVIAYLNESHK